MYCRRSAVDDDRSRKTRLAFDDVRRQERWAVDDDRSRIAFYQAQSKESLDRVDRNLDLIRENLRAIRKMRKTSATIPRYSPSSSSISSFASRRHRPSRHDYPPLELPLRWREPPPLKPTKPHSAPFVRPMSSGEVDSDFIADPFQEHVQQLVGTRQVSAPATSAGVQDLANPAGDLISAHSASDSPTQHVSELDLSLPDLSIITGPDSVDEVYMNVGGEEMSKDDEDDCEVDQKMSENDDEDEGKDFRWSPDPGGTIQLSLPLSVASTPPLIQDRFSRFLDFAAVKTENPLCSRHFAPGIELHLSRPDSSIAAGLGIERRSPVVDPNRIPSSIFARSSMTPMEWSVAASESLFSIHMASLELDRSACIKVSPNLLGLQNDDTEWVNVELHSPKPSSDDWVGVFSPANFNASTCPTEVGNSREQEPLICSSPIKYQFANYSNAEYIKTGKVTLRFQMINQRSDFSFALFRGGLAKPKLIAGVKMPGLSSSDKADPTHRSQNARRNVNKGWDLKFELSGSAYGRKENRKLTYYGPTTTIEEQGIKDLDMRHGRVSSLLHSRELQDVIDLSKREFRDTINFEESALDLGECLHGFSKQISLESDITPHTTEFDTNAKFGQFKTSRALNEYLQLLLRQKLDLKEEKLNAANGVRRIAENIASLLAPQSGAHYDIWVDGEKVMSAEPFEVIAARNDSSIGTNFPASPKPIYGTLYLPQKFKIVVTVPTDNSVESITNDIGIVIVFDGDGEPQGFNNYVRGSMGMMHRLENTFPRLGEPLGYVPKEDILYAVKAIVVTQRANGPNVIGPITEMDAESQTNILLFRNGSLLQATATNDENKIFDPGGLLSPSRQHASTESSPFDARGE
ncbi:hypothetical protein KFK09_001152 [Dendrobium nobile]|uniref:Uncharacterized protein n=1 Tax=Dendrobium nobile TaxID=94219 RepID=A0A8T3C438_DENNO|nr:hypothetical protein KFK09_001152 [Dendrobium nobile]